VADRVLQVRFLGDTDQLGKATENIGSKFSGMKIAAGAAAVAAGAAITSGIASSLEFGTAQKKLEAQLGGASQLSRDAGEVAGSLYSQAYGSSLGDVNEAVRSVIQSGALMEGASKNQIEGITASAMSLAQAFNVDVSESMRAASQLVRTGLAPNATAAMDLITTSFQRFGPQAQDVLDTVTEYSTQFRKLGIDGPQAMGLIQQGLQAGARDTDTLADALKEFSIRAIDGSKTTADGFKLIGLNVDDMAKKFAQGGPVAQQALDTVIDRLRGMKDPLQQQTAAVDLFGTKAEDLGAALFAMDPSKAVSAFGEVTGAASRLDQTIGDTAQNKITAMQRKWEQWTASLVSSQGPIGDVATTLAAFGSGGLDLVSNIGMIALAMRGLGIASFFTAGGFTAAWAAATGPIGLTVAAIVGAAALIYFNWDKIKSFFSGLGETISGVFHGAIDKAEEFGSWLAGLPGKAAALPGQILSGLGQLPGMIGTWASNSWNSFSAATDAWWTGTALPWITNLPFNVGYAIGALIGILAKLGVDAWGAFWNGTTSVWNGTIWPFIRDTPGKIIDFVSSLPGRLYAWGTSSWTSAYNAVSGVWNGTIWPFITSIPGRVVGGIQALPGMLWNAGSMALHGLHDGALAAWGGFWGFITGIPGAIARGVGNLGSLLWNAGKSIIDGLLAGIKASYQSMINFVSGIGAGIAAHKGPLSYDRQLLVPAGGAIMAGLLTGIQTGYGTVESYVAAIARNLSGALVGSSFGAASPGALTAAAAGGGAIKLVVDSAGSRLDDVLVEVLKAAIRERGGDPGILGI
jgi:phage-related protein